MCVGDGDGRTWKYEGGGCRLVDCVLVVNVVKLIEFVEVLSVVNLTDLVVDNVGMYFLEMPASLFVGVWVP